MENSLLLRPLLDSFEEGLCVLDQEGGIRCMNTAAEQLTGYQQDELLGRSFPADIQFGLSWPPSRAAAGHWRSIQFQRKDGSKSEATYLLRPLGSTGNGPTLLRLRSCLRESARSLSLDDIGAKFSAIFDTIPDGLIVIDEAGAIRSFSSGADKMFGYRQDELLGANVKTLMPSPYRDAHDGYLAAYRNTGVKNIIGIGREVSGRRKNGSIFPLHLSVGEILLEEGRFFVGLTHDLTRLRNAEEQLITLSAAVDQSPIAVMIADKDGNITYVNSDYTRLTGYLADELIGQNILMFSSVDAVQQRHPQLLEAIRRRRGWRGEIQEQKKSGAPYWALETITPLHDQHGEITHYAFIQQDISEQKRDKEALAESEERFRHVAEMAGEWLWEQDPKGRYIYSSSAVRDILGFEPDEILGKCYFDLLADAPDAETKAAMACFLGGDCRQFRHLVNHYRHKNGQEVYTESTGAPLFDQTGRLAKWRGVDHDITARKGYIDALRVRNRAIESVRTGIVIADAQTPGSPNIYVNPALCEMTGYARDELLGRSMRLLQGPETDPAAVMKIRQALEAGESCEVTLKNYRKGGAVFWNELLISPVVDDGGKITHYIGIQNDVTERRRAEENRHEMEIAKHIQLSLLPSVPLRLPRIECSGLCAPANHVGGDYFDYFQTSDSVDAVIADVSGHSVGAALIMAEVRSTVRAQSRKATNGPSSPAQVLRVLNELLCDDLSKAEIFITMFYVSLDPATRLLRYANAGHNQGLLLRAAESACTLLDAEGLVLGVKRAVEFEQRSVQLSAGDQLLFYTDGIVEAQDPKGDFFGLERLQEAFKAHRGLAPETLVKSLFDEVRRFCGQSPPKDDIALVVMQIS